MAMNRNREHHRMPKTICRPFVTLLAFLLAATLTPLQANAPRPMGLIGIYEITSHHSLTDGSLVNRPVTPWKIAVWSDGQTIRLAWPGDTREETRPLEYTIYANTPVEQSSDDGLRRELEQSRQAKAIRGDIMEHVLITTRRIRITRFGATTSTIQIFDGRLHDSLAAAYPDAP